MTLTFLRVVYSYVNMCAIIIVFTSLYVFRYLIFEIYSSGAEEALLNAMNIPEAPEIDTDFGQILRKKKTQLKELLSMEILIGLMGKLGELYGERGSLNIPYNLRRLVKKYQGNFKHSSTKLKNLQANVKGILDGLRPSGTPPLPGPPATYLTKVKSFSQGLLNIQ